MKVYQCSNPACRTVWDADPEGHCPACRLPTGGGWSCITSEIRSLAAARCDCGYEELKHSANPYQAHAKSCAIRGHSVSSGEQP